MDNTSSQPSRTIADLIVDRLCEWQVERVYGYAGDGNNPLLGAFRRSTAGPRFISARHEEGAAFMAVGEAKFGGGVGVVTSTQGPGAVHLLNGLYDAKLDHAPVVALVAQQQRSVLGSGYQQEVNVATLFADVASAFIETVMAPEQLPMVLDRAFRSALAHRQPAVVVLPHDIQSAPAPDHGQSHGEVVTSPHWATPHTHPRAADIRQAAEILTAGRRVAVLAGRGVAGAGSQLLSLAERLGAGVTTSLLGKPFVDGGHPLVAGVMGHLGTPESAFVLQECDTLLIVGSDDPWTEFLPPPGSARAVQIDVSAEALGNRYPLECGVVGDAAAALEALNAELPDDTGPSWRTEVEQAVAAGREVAERRAAVSGDPVNPEYVARAVAARLPSGSRLALDVGSTVYHYSRQMTLPEGVDARLSSTLASMGCGIPYAVAAKEQDSYRPVVTVAGDGAMEMLGINELITVADRWRTWKNPQFVIVILNNRDLAEVSWEQRESEEDPRFPASQEVPLFPFADYAGLLGLHGIRISDPSTVERTLDEAFSVERPVVVEVDTDPDVPLLPPLPHGRALADSMRQGLAGEGEAGRHAVELLNEYVTIETTFGPGAKAP